MSGTSAGSPMDHKSYEDETDRLAGPDKTPLQERDELLKRIPNRIDLAECVLSYRRENADLEAEVVRLRQERDEALAEAARILSLALGKGITFEDLSVVASPDKPPELTPEEKAEQDSAGDLEEPGWR